MYARGGDGLASLCCQPQLLNQYEAILIDEAAAKLKEAIYTAPSFYGATNQINAPGSKLFHNCGQPASQSICTDHWQPFVGCGVKKTYPKVAENCKLPGLLRKCRICNTMLLALISLEGQAVLRLVAQDVIRKMVSLKWTPPPIFLFQRPLARSWPEKAVEIIVWQPGSGVLC
jgi:hypothetical protein